jgi:hypothetical protein
MTSRDEALDNDPTEGGTSPRSLKLPLDGVASRVSEAVQSLGYQCADSGTLGRSPAGLLQRQYMWFHDGGHDRAVYVTIEICQGAGEEPAGHEQGHQK